MKREGRGGVGKGGNEGGSEGRSGGGKGGLGQRPDARRKSWVLCASTGSGWLGALGSGVPTCVWIRVADIDVHVADLDGHRVEGVEVLLYEGLVHQRLPSRQVQV